MTFLWKPEGTYRSERSPWVHSEMFSFRPTENFEFGFQRTVIFGGEGHAPVTLHTFLQSFFDTNDTATDEKISRDDPGARFSDFNVSYRLPFVRKYLTFYVDSISHDDVTPISAPRRAAYRTGLYLSQIPELKQAGFQGGGGVDGPGSQSRAPGGSSTTGRLSRSRGTPTRGSFWATGSAVRPRAARHG